MGLSACGLWETMLQLVLTAFYKTKAETYHQFISLWLKGKTLFCAHTTILYFQGTAAECVVSKRNTLMGFVTGFWFIHISVIEFSLKCLCSHWFPYFSLLASAQRESMKRSFPPDENVMDYLLEIPFGFVWIISVLLECFQIIFTVEICSILCVKFLIHTVKEGV